jgi:hypothetical protein
MTRFEEAVKARYGSALKPRYMQASYGDREIVDRHERMNTEERRRRPDQCQFSHSSITPNHLVTIPEAARPLTATSHSKNSAVQGQQTVKKHSAVKERELAGSNLMAEIE